MEARDSKKNNQAKALKRPFQTNKGTFRVCHLWWVLTCKIPQAATARVWDAVGLHVQILTYPEETLTTPSTLSKGFSEDHSAHSLQLQPGRVSSWLLQVALHLPQAVQ